MVVASSPSGARPLAMFAIALVCAAALAGAAPASPALNPAQVSGSTVMLTWTVPFGATGIRLEAGTQPGLSNAASVVLGAVGAYTATGVPAGLYYVRVRSIDASGESAPSNEVAVAVGGGSCATAPLAPTLAAPQVTANVVVLSWTPAAAGCPATAFTVLAGTAPGLTNLGTVPTATPRLTASAANGTYYVRVFAQNAVGQSPVSNEVVFTLGGGPALPAPPSPLPPAPPPPPPTLAGSFGPGQWRVGADIVAGRYFADPVAGCYWERRGPGGVRANEFIDDNPFQWVVDILADDTAFETTAACGTWSTTPRVAAAGSGIANGLWLVGRQVVAGTYRVTAAPGCYWERTRDFTGQLSGIIENGFVPTGGSQFVTIAVTDAGFLNDGCGTWTRLTPPTAAAAAAARAEDIELTWRAKYADRTGNEPRLLIKQ